MSKNIVIGILGALILGGVAFWYFSTVNQTPVAEINTGDTNIDNKDAVTPPVAPNTTTKDTTSISTKGGTSNLVPPALPE